MIREFFRTLLEILAFWKSPESAKILSDSPPTTTALIRRTYRVVKAIREFRLERGRNCAWCGTDSSVEIHHVVPIWKRADLAADQSNLFPLCKRCHIVLGHAGSFRDRYVKNIREICDLKNLIDRRNLEEIERS